MHDLVYPVFLLTRGLADAIHENVKVSNVKLHKTVEILKSWQWHASHLVLQVVM